MLLPYLGKSFLNLFGDLSDLLKGKFVALLLEKVFDAVCFDEQNWISGLELEHLHHSRQVVAQSNELAKLLISNLR